MSLFLRLSIKPQTKAHQELLSSGKLKFIPDPTYGGQLQDLGIGGHAGEGQMHISYAEHEVTLGGGEVISLRKPTYSIKKPAYGPLHKDLLISPRLTPPVIGLGLLEGIDPKDILKAEDPGDRDGDGISGKANWVWNKESQKLELGRFGWKAGSPSVAHQVQSAFLGDMGLSTPFFPAPYGDCTPLQKYCRKAPHGGDALNPEIPQLLVDYTVFFTKHLAVPARDLAERSKVQKGRQLFRQMQCALCHTPQFKTQQSLPDKALANQTITPWTDLLLHDMGPGLADNRPEGRANGREWRTPPLWGLGKTAAVSGQTHLLHDGRARSIAEAILWHGGEGEKAREKFRNAPADVREALLAFLRSL